MSFHDRVFSGAALVCEDISRRPSSDRADARSRYRASARNLRARGEAAELDEEVEVFDGE